MNLKQSRNGKNIHAALHEAARHWNPMGVTGSLLLSFVVCRALNTPYLGMLADAYRQPARYSPVFWGIIIWICSDIVIQLVFLMLSSAAQLSARIQPLLSAALVYSFFNISLHLSGFVFYACGMPHPVMLLLMLLLCTVSLLCGILFYKKMLLQVDTSKHVLPFSMIFSGPLKFVIPLGALGVVFAVVLQQGWLQPYALLVFLLLVALIVDLFLPMSLAKRVMVVVHKFCDASLNPPYETLPFSLKPIPESMQGVFEWQQKHSIFSPVRFRILVWITALAASAAGWGVWQMNRLHPELYSKTIINWLFFLTVSVVVSALFSFLLISKKLAGMFQLLQLMVFSELLFIFDVFLGYLITGAATTNGVVLPEKTDGFEAFYVLFLLSFLIGLIFLKKRGTFTSLKVWRNERLKSAVNTAIIGINLGILVLFLVNSINDTMTTGHFYSLLSTSLLTLVCSSAYITSRLVLLWVGKVCTGRFLSK